MKYVDISTRGKLDEPDEHHRSACLFHLASTFIELKAFCFTAGSSGFMCVCKCRRYFLVSFDIELSDTVCPGSTSSMGEDVRSRNGWFFPDRCTVRLCGNPIPGYQIHISIPWSLWQVKNGKRVEVNTLPLLNVHINLARVTLPFVCKVTYRSLANVRINLEKDSFWNWEINTSKKLKEKFKPWLPLVKNSNWEWYLGKHLLVSWAKHLTISCVDCKLHGIKKHKF